ncbi:MAG: hypothetical protein ACOX3T_07290 [Bdellovibrionota bacterium]
MYSPDEISEIFEKISDYYQEPVNIGSRCQSNYYYRVENLSEKDLNICAEHVAYRIRNVLSPQEPQLFIKLPGGYSFFAERLYAVFSEIISNSEEIAFEQYLKNQIQSGYLDKYKGYNTVLITDVITTARSTLEAHTKLSLRGIPILSWVALIDRTFGPGPVPVISAYTGSPVKLLNNY